jgi:ribosomal protein S18 acetylase RimI-like enzyme
MNTSTRIRPAHLDDIDQVAMLLSKVVSSLEIYTEESREDEIHKFSSEKLALRIKRDPNAVSVALRDNRLAGFLITEDQHGPIWIHWYGVDPDFRSRSVGEAILRHLISSGRDRKATKIWCDTRTNNIPSISLLEKLNFTRLCEIRNHWYGQDYCLWARDVT